MELLWQDGLACWPWARTACASEDGATVIGGGHGAYALPALAGRVAGLLSLEGRLPGDSVPAEAELRSLRLQARRRGRACCWT